jgi:nucleoside-diphosphate-sugar epimerase
VTGATGFLGAYIALALLERGVHVRGVVRDPASGAWLEERGVELVEGNLLDAASLGRAFAGVDAVVSNAALFGLRRISAQDYRDTNVQGTRNVFHACDSAGVGRIVHVSSISVYRKQLLGTVKEDAPKLVERDARWTWAYELTKALSEEEARRCSEAHGQALTLVRPGPIYGQRDRNLGPLIERLMAWPFLPVPDFHLPFVHAQDAAITIANALERDHSIGKAYNLTDRPRSMARFLRIWKAARGSGPLMLPVPLPYRPVFDASAAQEDLGFSPRSLEDGIAEALSGTLP